MKEGITRFIVRGRGYCLRLLFLVGKRGTHIKDPRHHQLEQAIGERRVAALKYKVIIVNAQQKYVIYILVSAVTVNNIGILYNVCV